jgi:hypothetical protein
MGSIGDLLRIVVPALLGLIPSSCLNASPRVTSKPSTQAYAIVEPTPVAPPTTPPTPAEPLKELPGGGRTLFPEHRLVGFCGTPGAPALGELQGNLPVKAKKLVARAAQFADGRKILPVFELIAVVVQGSPGPDGKYRRRVGDAVVDEYLRLARASNGILLLNVQPGQSDFLTEVKTFDSYLHEPDVGVALDPEWAMKPKQRPGATWGQTTGQAINDVADYLSGIVDTGHLPEKALVFHEVVKEVVKDELSMRTYPGVVIIKSVDGLGPAHTKVATYGNLMGRVAAGVHPGFKLFFDEDTRNGSYLMSAKQVLALYPRPEYVMYE